MNNCQSNRIDRRSNGSSNSEEACAYAYNQYTDTPPYIETGLRGWRDVVDTLSIALE
jgi:hypothetical protein